METAEATPGQGHVVSPSDTIATKHPVALEGAASDDSSGEEHRRKRKRAGTACTACHKSKVKCDNQQPCSRCLRRGTLCVPRVAKKRGRKPKLDYLVLSEMPASKEERYYIPADYVPSAADSAQLALIQKHFETLGPFLEKKLNNDHTRHEAKKLLQLHMRLTYHQGNYMTCSFMHKWATSRKLTIDPSSVKESGFSLVEGLQGLSLSERPTPEEPVLTSSALHAMFYVIRTEDGLQLHCNDKFSLLTGLSVAEIKKQALRGYHPPQLLLHKDDLPAFLANHACHLEVGYHQTEHTLRMKTASGYRMCYLLCRTHHKYNPIRTAISWQCIPLPVGPSPTPSKLLPTFAPVPDSAASLATGAGNLWEGGLGERKEAVGEGLSISWPHMDAGGGAVPNARPISPSLDDLLSHAALEEFLDITLDDDDADMLAAILDPTL